MCARANNKSMEKPKSKSSSVNPRKRKITSKHNKAKCLKVSPTKNTSTTDVDASYPPEDPFDHESPDADFWQHFLAPKLEHGREQALYRWMLQFGLLRRQTVCTNSECGGSNVQWLVTNRFRDKAVWECRDCKQSMSIRAGSFFVNLKSDIKCVLAGIQAWCNRIPVNLFCQANELKLQVGRRIYQNCYESVENFLMSANEGLAAKEWVLGGEGTVVLLDVWPNGLLPAAQNSGDKKKRWSERLCVLWLADTNCVPVRYWASVLPPLKPNKKIKKKEGEMERTTEMALVVASMVQEHTRSGSLVLANEKALPTVCETLRALGNYEAVMSVDDLLAADCNGYQPTKNILNNIWHGASELCEELQTATHSIACRKLCEFLWRNKFEMARSRTVFNLLSHIALQYSQQPHNSVVNSTNISTEN